VVALSASRLMLHRFSNTSVYLLFLFRARGKNSCLLTCAACPSSPKPFYLAQIESRQELSRRILVSLRTEYYGRFRDELRISDDRLSDRPKSGDVEPYLLRPLREKAALIGVVEFPTTARKADGTLVYNFVFEDGLVNRFVDDLLTKLPHASVTPALHVLCASLFELLTDKDRITPALQFSK
jgi:hypothetical protein